MSLRKELLNFRTLINSLVFSLPISALLVWRFAYVNHQPLFSADMGKVYLVFVGFNLVVYILFQLLMYWLSKRKQQPED